VPNAQIGHQFASSEGREGSAQHGVRLQRHHPEVGIRTTAMAHVD